MPREHDAEGRNTLPREHDGELDIHPPLLTPRVRSFGWRRRSLRCGGARRRGSGRRLGARQSLAYCACCRAKRGLAASRARTRLPVPDETGLAVSWPHPAFLGTLRKLPLLRGSGRARRASIWTATRRTSLSPSLAPRGCCRAKRGLAAFGTHPPSQRGSGGARGPHPRYSDSSVDFY